LSPIAPATIKVIAGRMMPSKRENRGFLFWTFLKWYIQMPAMSLRIIDNHPRMNRPPSPLRGESSCNYANKKITAIPATMGSLYFLLVYFGSANVIVANDLNEGLF
jgi:hypothetical protein